MRIQFRGPWVGLAVLVGLLVAMLGATNALAAPTIGPSGSAFYTPPSPLPSGAPGTLVWYRPTTVSLGPAAPAVDAWDVLYLSTDVDGNTFPVTGTVIVPTAAYSGGGTRPVIDYAYGTQGLAQRCAPSLQLAAGTEYDASATLASLEKGYAVVATDYRGYTTGSKPTYVSAADEGDAVLDVDRAAAQIPGSGVSLSAKTFIWGYSQGGGAATYAGESQPSYAPEINLTGVAAGGVPADLISVLNFSNNSVDSAFVMYSVLGLLNANPFIAPGAVLNSQGLAYAATLENDCALQDVGPPNSDQDIDSFLINPIETLLANPTFSQLVASNDINASTPPVPVPYFQYSGEYDEFVPLTQQVALKQAECSLGVTDDYHLYPSDHLITDPAAVPDVLTWIGNLLAGQPAPSTCNLNEPLPAGARTAPEFGDLTVPLNDWALGGSMTLKKLGLSLAVPSTASITALADITSGQFSGTATIPPITQTMKILGIPLRTTVALTLTGPLSGNVSLNTTTGVLSLSGTSSANVTIQSAGIGPLTIPLGCRTKSPVPLSLSISQPVGQLIGAKFTASGTTTFPQLTGCGIIGPILSLLVSGSGNPYTLTISEPPAIPF